jgi:hypothetical protein
MAYPAIIPFRSKVQDKSMEPPVKLMGCMTGISNDIVEHLAKIKLGGAAASFCFHMQRQTQGYAGKQRNEHREDPGLSCDFNLAKWSKELNINKSNLRRVRADLEACRVILFQETNPGEGILSWNINFNEWQQYNKRPGRTQTNEEKRQEKQKGVVILTDQDTQQDSVVILSQNHVNLTTVDCVNLTTVDSLDDNDGQVWQDPLIRVTEEDLNKLDANASFVGAANASATISPPENLSQSVETKRPTAHEIDIDPKSKGHRTAAYLRDRIKEFKPDAKIPETTERLEGWAQQARLMIEIDHRDPHRIKAIIDAIADPRASPWWQKQRKYVLCMEKLRTQFDFLDQALKEDEQKGKIYGKTSPNTPKETHETTLHTGIVSHSGEQRSERSARIAGIVAKATGGNKTTPGAS